MMATIADDLRTILDADVTALTIWLQSQVVAAGVAAEEPLVRGAVERLIDLEERIGVDRAALLASPAQSELRTYLEPLMRANEYLGFAVIDRQGKILASRYDDTVGSPLSASTSSLTELAEKGVATVSHPFIPETSLRDRNGVLQPGDPAMVAMAPVRNADGAVVASLLFRMDPEDQFTRILRTARYGESGETYAFNANGLLLSESRFDDELRELGLIAADSRSHSILQVQIRDPGGNMLDGFRSSVPRDEQPLTRMAAAAMRGRDGVDVDGYRDYRGVPVVGAWPWLGVEHPDRPEERPKDGSGSTDSGKLAPTMAVALSDRDLSNE
jgi:hypothetical protein